MRVLVTGASGFVGAHLGQLLRTRGHHVTTLSREGDVDHRVDVTEKDEVVRVVRAAAPDGIVHLAAVAFVPDAESDADERAYSSWQLGENGGYCNSSRGNAVRVRHPQRAEREHECEHPQRPTPPHQRQHEARDAECQRQEDVRHAFAGEVHRFTATA